MAQCLLNKNATVTICHSKTQNIAEFTKKADIIISAVGKINMVTEDMVKDGAIEFLDKNFGKEVILAGNSIHQDRKFIEREMPELNKRLHYRMLDVSAWKVYFENALNKKFMKREEHRALDDIEGSIEELKYYVGMFSKDNDIQDSVLIKYERIDQELDTALEKGNGALVVEG